MHAIFVISNLTYNSMDPPHILRIKRKRGQDPLQALILEERRPAKKSKPSSPISSKPLTPTPEAKNYYFQLSRTDSADVPDPEVLASVLSEAASAEEHRHFVIPKKQTEEDTVIPNELSDMLDSYLNVDGGNTSRRRRRGRPATEEEPPVEDEYVFDVYKLSATEPLTKANYPLSQIGYIRFFDDDEYDLMQSDDDAKSALRDYSDDEDSNAESFYQNDYPEDEDAGSFSETYESDADESDAEIPVILDSAEGLEGHAYLSGHVQADQTQFDALYDDFFDENGERKVDFLDNDSEHASGTYPADYDDGDEEYERNHFFDGDEEDDLAIHRDKIIGRLQKMIDKS